MRKLAVLCLGLTFLTTALVGCGSDESVSDGTSLSSPTPAVAPPGLREQAPSPADGKGQGNEVSTRKEVVTGSVDITAHDPIAAAATVADRVRAAGGRIDSRTEQPDTEDNDPAATLTVRVPGDKTDAFIDGLGGVGEVTRVSTNREDVTMQWEDLDAKIKALQASVDRLRALIASATNTADLIAAENALSSRQGELDSLTAQKRRLDDQVALSSLTIDITATETETEGSGPDNFWDGLVSGWNSLVDWLQDAIVFAGKAIPWLGFLAVLGVLGWGIARAVRWRGTSTRSHGSVPVAGPAKSESAAAVETATSEESGKSSGTKESGE
ncbi:DUF4349 domain-containing protein [Nocardia bovistercoris]|uniref:DUF4349 domain-containing protein n=1 Tax=Nocardia bovistercoris TaxID=2785916 RepID=A0A931I9L5_9NOCA|nr:DUF4349 domain-containing protein [Nocardia bovistercoris]MBH0777492.1 DUF4349 domain-containing protein [Nocardia bovistercoris]